MRDSSGPEDIAKQAREHAWDWFALHANQRMQTFNYFLLATAFLVAAYGSLLKDYPAAAVAVALLGAWFAFWFRQLDVRTRHLIDAGRRALIAAQARLAEEADIPHLNIIKSVDPSAAPQRVATYNAAIGVVQWTIVVAFLAAAAYAGFAAYKHGPG